MSPIMIKILLGVLTFCFCFAPNIHIFAFLERYDSSVVNALPSNDNLLKIHIFSADDDLGYHYLMVGQNFQWTFKMNFFETTKFYGHFWWSTKEREFAVFDKKLAYDHCRTDFSRMDRANLKKKINICMWVVKEDGFYLSNKTNPSPNDLVLLNKWLFT